MTYQHPWRRPERAGTRPVSFAVLLAGVGLLVIGLNGHAPRWSPPPAPPQSAAANSAPLPRSRHAGGLTRSVPVLVDVPAIGVRARVIPLGVAPGGQIAVPSLSTPFLASWYDLGPAPGQIGTAVLLGHVDAAGVGPAVFYRLGDLRPGDLVYVSRRDHRTPVFRVTAVRMYPEDSFPAARLYASNRRPELRLITCGGQFDWQTHLYLDRVVVFAVYAGG
jgi:hypothetical protein